MQVTNYKCPSCTAPLHFVGETGKLECDYCGSSYDTEQIEAMYAQTEQKAAEDFQQEQQERREAAGEWDASQLEQEWAEEGVRMYNCPSCGAQLICEETTAATSCPYCGNAAIVPGQLSGMLRPDYVLPFQLSKDAAVEALKKHYKGKVFLPKVFSEDNHIQQIKGVYVPFWLYDGTVDADITYKATRVRTKRRGDEIITSTDHFLVRRAGTVQFEKIPVDASTKMPDEYMDAIEPFDYSKLEPFSTAYLPGFLADKYDMTMDQCAGRAEERAGNTARDTLRSDVIGYATCVPVSQNIRLNRGRIHYALLPVWLLHTRYKEQDYLFAMNGQSGKMVGKLPVNWGKFWGMFCGLGFGLMLLFSLFG